MTLVNNIKLNFSSL